MSIFKNIGDFLFGGHRSADCSTDHSIDSIEFRDEIREYCSYDDCYDDDCELCDGYLYNDDYLYDDDDY